MKTAKDEWIASIYADYGESSDEELRCIPSKSGGAYFTSFLVESCMQADIPIVKSLYVQSGLYLQSKGARYEHIIYNGYSKGGYEIKGSPLYLQIPVLLSYRCDFGDVVQLQVNFGPYFAYGVGGKCKIETWDKYNTDRYSYDFFGDDLEDIRFNRFDCGLQVGAGFTFAKHYYVGFAYEFGLTNSIEVSREYRDQLRDLSVKNSNWMLGIGYNF